MPPRDRQRLQPRTPIQSGGPGGEFGGSQRLYTGRNPFMTPNDPGMDFGAPQRTTGPRDMYQRRPDPGPGYFGPGPHQRPSPPNIGRDRMGGIFGGRGASSANEMVNAMMGGMNRPQQYGYDVAELTQDQMNMMGNPLNTPDFGVSKEDLWNKTKAMEDQGFFGWGAQEPTTQEEFEDYYRQLQEGSVGNWVT